MANLSIVDFSHILDKITSRKVFVPSETLRCPCCGVSARSFWLICTEVTFSWIVLIDQEKSCEFQRPDEVMLTCSMNPLMRKSNHRVQCMHWVSIEMNGRHHGLWGRGLSQCFEILKYVP